MHPFFCCQRLYYWHRQNGRCHTVKTLLITGSLVLAAFSAIPAAERPAGVFESAAALTPQNPVDELVFARLKELNIQPAPVCSDAVFVRRVYLDVIGTLPKGFEAEQFVLDRNPNKRTGPD